MIIYKITNKIDGKMYIGQTVQRLKDRWHDHVRGDKNPDGYLQRAIAKYGVDNFTVEEIDSAKTIEGLNVLEAHYILALNTLSPNGYNLLLGGNNRECHKETKAKISSTMKGREIPNRWNKGNSTSPSEQTREKISETLKGRPIANRWTQGNKTPRTEAQKAYLSALNQGIPNIALHKEVEVVETGVVYPSINTVAQVFDLHRTTISGLLKSGKQHKKLGISFRYKKVA